MHFFVACLVMHKDTLTHGLYEAVQGCQVCLFPHKVWLPEAHQKFRVRF